MKISDFFEISTELEDRHEIFHAFWNLGIPKETNEIDTLAVSFFDDQIYLLINPEFWEMLDTYERAFVICHESLHVILRHLKRFSYKDYPELARTANVAMDICVNHMLTRRFDFERERLSIGENLIWVDKVFTKEEISTLETFEFYFEKLKREQENKKEKGRTIGNHGQVQSEDMPQSVVERLRDYMSEGAKESLGKVLEEGGTPAGSGVGNLTCRADTTKVATKRKWETVITQWTKNNLGSAEIYNWRIKDRRHALISKEFFLPSLELDPSPDMIDLVFFQDTSGSCSGYINRFFKAAKTLPKERFNVHMCCFDTRVYETSLDSGKLYGFGGTRFDILETYLLQEVKKGKMKYPKAVFVITDGYGNRLSPCKPKNWHWFLTPRGSRGCIPKDCNIYDLANFE